MRGKLGFCPSCGKALRNIPAYAGKTGVDLVDHGSSPEHPRVCGENALLTGVNLAKGGTSPRMRGKLARAREDAAASRNIPAYAGKTNCLG